MNSKMYYYSNTIEDSAHKKYDSFQATSATDKT